MKRITALLLSALLTLSLTACGAKTDTETTSTSTDAAEPVTVRIGLTGTFNEEIWAPTAEKLAQEGIVLEYVQFSNFFLPNDATNGGRAIKLLESAGILTVDPAAGASPTVSDVVSYHTQVEFVEVDANLVYSTLPDVTIAVINGNYALDSGLTADEALFKETEYDDNRYFGLIAVRSEDADNPIYQRIVEVYQSQDTIDVFNNQFAGFFVPAWTLDVG